MEKQRKLVLENTVERILELCFPKIKGLVVTADDNNISITFEEGEYSKEDVEAKLEEIKNEIQDPIDISQYNIDKTEFGFTFKK